MNLEDGDAPNPSAVALVKADEAAQSYSDSGSVGECPLAKKKPAEKKPPVVALLWRIRELGGGFSTPAVRPDYCIQSYAAIVKASKADVLMVMGLTSTIGWTPKNQGVIVKMEEEIRDTGLDEAKRILAALGSGWQLATVNGADGKPAYFRSQTACFFYRTDKGIGCGTPIVTACGDAFLAVAPMKIPSSFDSPPDLPLMAPMSVGAKPFAVKTPPDPKPTGVMPPNGVVGFSAADSLGGDQDYACLRTECDVDYAPPLREGTRLKLPYWEVVSERDEALLENFTALNAADVTRQDNAMHWEAIKKEKDPNSLGKVYGRLADSLLVRNTGGGQAPRMEKTRIVDLVRAALDAEVLAKVGAGAAAREDSCLAAIRKQHTESAPHVKSVKADAVVENQIAEAALFARKLSDHWPVVADVHLATRRS